MGREPRWMARLADDAAPEPVSQLVQKPVGYIVLEVQTGRQLDQKRTELGSKSFHLLQEAVQ